MQLFQLNVLSKEAKAEGRYALLRVVSIRFGIVLAVLTVLFGVLLLPSYFLTSLQKGEFLRQIESEEKNPLRQQAREVAELVGRSKRELKAVKTALTSERAISGLLPVLLEGLPAGIAFDRVEFDLVQAKIKFSGRAVKRNDVLDFEKRLKAIPFITEVISPLSNIIRESDAAFVIEAKFRK